MNDIMQRKQEEKEFIVEDSTESFATWINKPYIPTELKKELRNANILIVPMEEFREKHKLLFPAGTEDLYAHLKNYTSEGINTDICISNQDYKELALHFDYIQLGSFILNSIVAPLVITILYNYIEHRWKNIHNKNLKIDLTVVDQDHSTHIYYEGPTNEFKDTIIPTLKKLQKKK